MRTMVLRLVRTIACGASLAAVPAAMLAGERTADAHGSVSVVVTADFPTFHDALSPYGNWVDLPGRTVWVPNAAVVGAHFRPYDSGGRWVYTDEGWYFETAWGWGAIPFHYGRWMFEAPYGWVWVAGYDWAPAWVDWSYGGGYVGWAPLPPSGVSVEIDSPHWYYVEERHFAEPHVAIHVLPVARAHYAATVALPIRAPHATGRWYAGPAAASVSRASGRPIYTARISAPAAGADYRVKPIHHGAVVVPAARLPAVRAAGPRAPMLERTGKSAPVRMAPSHAPARMAPGHAPARMAPAPAPARVAPAPVSRTPPPARPPMTGPAPRKMAPDPLPRPAPPARTMVRPPDHAPPSAAAPRPMPRVAPPAPRPPPPHSRSGK